VLALVDLALGLVVGRLVFGVPIRGSVLLLLGAAAVYLVVALATAVPPSVLHPTISLGYGALPEHFPAVGVSLLATLRHFAGDAWSPQAEAAWAEAARARAARPARSPRASSRSRG